MQLQQSDGLLTNREDHDPEQHRPIRVFCLDECEHRRRRLWRRQLLYGTRMFGDKLTMLPSSPRPIK